MVTKGYGLTVKDIDESCPKDLEVYDNMHRQELMEADRLNYYLGMYFMSAASTVLSNALEKHSKAEYADEPILAKLFEKAEGNKSPESKEICAKFEMQQRIKMLRTQGLPESPS